MKEKVNTGGADSGNQGTGGWRLSHSTYGHGRKQLESRAARGEQVREKQTGPGSGRNGDHCHVQKTNVLAQ